MYGGCAPLSARSSAPRAQTAPQVPCARRESPPPPAPLECSSLHVLHDVRGDPAPNARICDEPAVPGAPHREGINQTGLYSASIVAWADGAV